MMRSRLNINVSRILTRSNPVNFSLSKFSNSSFKNIQTNRFALAHRNFSTAPPSGEQPGAGQSDSQKGELKRLDYDEYDDYEVPKDAKSAVRFYSVLFSRLLLMAGIVGCAGFLLYQLWPTRLSPTGLFSEVFEFLRYKEEVRFF
jgi:hypothetical protein